MNNTTTNIDNAVRATFIDGAKVEIVGSDRSKKYDVTFIDDDTGELVYKSTIHAGEWSSPNAKYYVRWHIKVHEDGKLIFDHVLDLAGKDVLVSFDSKALGDTVAWAPAVEEFRKIHKCNITVVSFRNRLLRDVYPDIKFVDTDQKDTPLPGIYALYRLGAFDKEYNRNKNNWRIVPLQRIATDILGVSYKEMQPRVKRSDLSAPIDKPYVCITEFSTWQAKLWNRPDGWQELVNMLNDYGYEVMSISKEPTKLRNVIKANGQHMDVTIRNIQHAKLFIGVSCGPVVLAWALGVPVCIISGASSPSSEFQNCIRVLNRSVCNGCFSDLRNTLDRGNWKYCPHGKDFICTKAITPEMVFDAIKPVLGADKFVASVKKRVMLLTPHCSTGGGPQYLYKCADALKLAGHEVHVVEYQNLSDHYVVQKNKLKQIVQFSTLSDDKARSFGKVMDSFNPDVVHVHEFPERFMSKEVAELLYTQSRNYKIIETPHGNGFMPNNKQYKPDSFAFVSPYYASIFKDYGVPVNVVEYEVEQHTRPDRSLALQRLGLDPGRTHVLNVGLFTPDKNQGEAFEVARRFPSAVFHFVGNTAMNFKGYWEPLLKHKPDNCILWGEQDDVDRFYSAMDVFLFTSKRELFPIVIKEALAWQMPVLMRKLDVYCGVYDDNSLITYIDDNIERTCALLGKYCTAKRRMLNALEQSYLSQ